MVFWGVLFLGVFVLGPWVFVRLMRFAPTSTVFARLVAAGVMCAAASLWLRFVAPLPWGVHTAATWIGMILIWLAWILALAFGAHALRRADPSAGMARWTRVIGAIGTTMPWFGLASARMMSS